MGSPSFNCLMKNMIIFSVAVLLLLMNPSECIKEEDKLLFFFGDSLFDPGNNQFFNPTDETRRMKSWPYGMDLNHKEATGRASDGWIIPDFIAISREVPMMQPYLQPDVDTSHGANFASAGSGILEIHPGVMNLRMQLDNLKKFVQSMKQELNNEQLANDVLKRSVYLFNLGANDYVKFNTDHPKATDAERNQHVQTVIDTLQSGLKEICYQIGGRRFGFQNIGPLGCLPIIKQRQPELNGNCQNELQNFANMHNTALTDMLNKLSLELPDLKYSIFDFNRVLTESINNPSTYGFVEGKIACCGTGQFNGENCGIDKYNLCQEPSDYVFFDGGHTSQKANSQYADLMWSGDPNITAPLNVKQLFDMP